MLRSIEIRETPTLEGLAVEFDAPQAELGVELPAAYDRLHDAIEQAGLTIGPAFAVYTDTEIDPAQMHVVAGFQTRGDGRAAPDDAEHRSFPGGKAAVGIAVGPYDQLSDRWMELWAWVGEQGEKPNGAPYELYRVNPDEGNPEEYETDLVIPLA